MNKKDTVKIKDNHPRAGLTGTIIESSKGEAHVYWANEEIFWILQSGKIVQGDITEIEVVKESEDR